MWLKKKLQPQPRRPWAALVSTDCWLFVSSFGPFWPKSCTLMNPTQTRAGEPGRKFCTLAPPNTQNTEEGAWGFHQIHLAAPGGVSKTGNECGTGHVWWGSILSCKDRAVVQRRTSPPGSPWGNDQLTGKGQHVRPFVVSFCYFFVRDLIQPLEAQLQKALADPI